MYKKSKGVAVIHPFHHKKQNLMSENQKCLDVNKKEKRQDAIPLGVHNEIIESIMSKTKARYTALDSAIKLKPMSISTGLNGFQSNVDSYDVIKEAEKIYKWLLSVEE